MEGLIKQEEIIMNRCERRGHTFVERYDEEIIKQHNDYHETHVKKTYLFDICIVCGEKIKRDG